MNFKITLVLTHCQIWIFNLLTHESVMHFIETENQTVYYKVLLYTISSMFLLSSISFQISVKKKNVFHAIFLLQA